MTLVLATLWAAAAGRGEFAFFLLAFEFLFAVCMAAGVWYVAGKLRVSAKTEDSAVTRGERGKFILEIENPFFRLEISRLLWRSQAQAGSSGTLRQTERAGIRGRFFWNRYTAVFSEPV